jgi:hypothetical protein
MILVVLGVLDTFAKGSTEKLKVLKGEKHEVLLYPRPTSGVGAKDAKAYVAQCLDALVADCTHRLTARDKDAHLPDYGLVVVNDRGEDRRGEDEHLLSSLIQREWIPALPYAVVAVWQTTAGKPGFQQKIVKDIFDAVRFTVPRFVSLHRQVRPHINHITEPDLCLPMRNFMAGIGLDGRLREAARLPDERRSAMIPELVAEIRRVARFRKIPPGQKKHGLGVYSRPDNLEFRTPGGDQHGALVRAGRPKAPSAADPQRDIADGRSKHGSACKLAGLLRFGIGLNQGFHFDCQDPEGRLFNMDFAQCH